MTGIYFIRHAQADNSINDVSTRPLTEKGMNDCALVTAFLSDKQINAVFSSPFKRAVDTVADFAEKNVVIGTHGVALSTHKGIFSYYREN